MKRALLIVLLAVSAFGAGFVFDRWLHRPIIVRLSTAGYPLHVPNAFGPLKPHGADDGACGLFNSPDNTCQFRT